MPHIETISVRSPVTGQTVEANVYLPPGYRRGEQVPVIYCHFARVWFGLTALPYRLDDRMGDTERRFPRCLAVGLPEPENMEGWPERVSEEYGHLVAAVVAEVERVYQPLSGTSSRLLLAGSDGAVAMLNVAADHHRLFGRAALASPGWLVRDGDHLEPVVGGALRRISAAPEGGLPALWFCWGDTELEDTLPNRWEKLSRPNGQAVMDALKARGVPVEHRLYPGGHTVALWDRALPDAISFLLGSN